MAHNNDPYEPSEAVTSHPFWKDSFFWQNIMEDTATVGSLRSYLRDYDEVMARRDLDFAYKSFLAALKFDLDRIEGRRDP